MRFQLILSRTGKGNFLPFSYQYELSAWIYKIIEGADQEFSRFLHEEAFVSGARRFKLFTFSNLDLRPFKIHKDHGRIEMQGHEAVLQISFLIDKAAEHFIKGLFLNQHLGLGDRISRVDFTVNRIEACPPPVFRETMRYRTLSPVCLSRQGEKHAQYLRPDDPEYAAFFVSNLLEKFKALSLAGYDPEGLQQYADFSFRLLTEPRSRLITIKAFTEQQTQVRGYDYAFELTAPTALQEIGYYAGFGEKGSTGFGCVEERNE